MYPSARRPFRATLPVHVLSDYTASMKFSLLALVAVSFGTGVTRAETPPGELLAALNRVPLDSSACYKIEPLHHIQLRRGDAKLLFEEGTLTFFAPIEGKVTGAVFNGRGHVL